MTEGSRESCYCGCYGLKQTLIRQSEQLALALKAKNEALAQLNGLDALGRDLGVAPGHRHEIPTLATALRELQDSVQLLRTDLATAQKELAQLRPPEAKFRIGQVVRVTNGHSEYFRKLTRCSFNRLTQAYDYLDNRGAVHAEGFLEALNDDEK